MKGNRILRRKRLIEGMREVGRKFCFLLWLRLDRERKIEFVTLKLLLDEILEERSCKGGRDGMQSVTF